MFESSNNHLLHKEAIRIVSDNLPGSVDMDSIVGYHNKPYHLEWNNMKFLVKVAKATRKSSQRRIKWFYTLGNKGYEAVDYFILFALVENRIEGLYVIPKVFLPTTYITITKLNGTMRYDYFKTTLSGLPQFIMQVQKKLPKLIKLQKESNALVG